MKPRTHLIILFLTAFCIKTTFSQNWKIGGTLNLGMSKLTAPSPQEESHEIKQAVSGNLGLFFERGITSNSALGIEVLWVQMEVLENIKNRIFTYDMGQFIGSESFKYRLHSSYLGIPIYYQVKFGKLGFKGGVQPMLFLFASDTAKGETIFNGSPTDLNSKNTGLKLNRLDFGPKIGIDYQLNNRYRIRADYYHGWVDIFPKESLTRGRKNRQITVGINYFFTDH